MNKLNNIIIGSLIIAIAGAYIWLGSLPEYNVIIEGDKVIVEERNVGALSGPDISNPYLAWGEVRQWAAQRTLATGTSTVCSLASPEFATSTLTHAALEITLGSSSALSVDFTRSASPGQTSSSTNRLGAGLTLLADKKATYTASTTDNDAIFAPNTNLNFVMSPIDGQTGGISATAATGNCSAVWVQTLY